MNQMRPFFTLIWRRIYAPPPPALSCLHLTSDLKHKGAEVISRESTRLVSSHARRRVHSRHRADGTEEPHILCCSEWAFCFIWQDLNPMIDAEAAWVTSETPVTGLEAAIGSNLLFFFEREFQVFAALLACKKPEVV